MFQQYLIDRLTYKENSTIYFLLFLLYFCGLFLKSKFLFHLSDLAPAQQLKSYDDAPKSPSSRSSSVSSNLNKEPSSPTLSHSSKGSSSG